MKRQLLFIFLGIVTNTICSQNVSTGTILKEVVVVADQRIAENSTGYKIRTLKDSILLKNTESFTALLRFNAPIYFKEYGAGGTSTASFRGTSASNTAVIWNGININSINSGQTGFNSLTVSLFDQIDIRSGGGSIEYGSGAIGGTIHLSDALVYRPKKTIQNQFVASVGSFSTYRGLYKFKMSSENFSLKIGFSYNQSENDYKLLGTRFKNTNGAYHNSNTTVTFGYRTSLFSQLKLYSTNYKGTRFFSGELPNPKAANDKYKDINQRNLLVYTHEKDNISQELKFGFLTQEYQYFGDKDSDNFNFGRTKRYLSNYSIAYRLPEWHSTITSYSEYESVFGKTDGIVEKNRRQFSQSFEYQQRVQNLFSFDIKVRKDLNSDFKVPVSLALGVQSKKINHVSFRANGSKNYRVPTFNDLYWPGQGNQNLIPETAMQGEFGVVFKKNKMNIDVSVFYIDAKNKIVWIPNGDSERPGVWTPMNLANTENRGIELASNYTEVFGHHAVTANVNYAYTIAKDKRTNTFLMFVPKHLLNSSFAYRFKQVGLFYQQLFTGKTFTTASNSKDFIISSFFVANIGGDYSIIQNKNQKVSIGFKVNNVFNENYVTQPRRPMPNRNFNLNINYKF
ncbi:putative TonB-dependent outer membrane receptor [Polaribacter irgensii 23-P]|uniref:Putative TonB-dependent outer membrane receptor n=1 Tax=Polaribacter irgensii 23-P TaxID=313594 RepID=A4C0B7_9FLAO|nr:TonB-dependent receptor [Polaribacter irgensii]EAR12860.1 putative TonB-dependent outer membrane receptor [Polaribacter irgensii 23-P]